jgi:hypothetical protein
LVVATPEFRKIEEARSQAQTNANAPTKSRFGTGDSCPSLVYEFVMKHQCETYFLTDSPHFRTCIGKKRDSIHGDIKKREVDAVNQKLRPRVAGKKLTHSLPLWSKENRSPNRSHEDFVRFGHHIP